MHHFKSSKLISTMVVAISCIHTLNYFVYILINNASSTQDIKPPVGTCMTFVHEHLGLAREVTAFRVTLDFWEIGANRLMLPLFFLWGHNSEVSFIRLLRKSC